MAIRAEAKINKLGFTGAIGDVVGQSGELMQEPEFKVRMTKLLETVTELFPEAPYFGIIVDEVMCEAFDSKRRNFIANRLAETVETHFEALANDAQLN